MRVVWLKTFCEFAPGSQFLAAMDQRDSRTNLRQQQRVLHRRISAADYANILSGEELSIASSGFYHSLPGKLFFTGHAELPWSNTGCDHDRDRLEVLTTLQRDAVRF